MSYLPGMSRREFLEIATGALLNNGPVPLPIRNAWDTFLACATPACWARIASRGAWRLSRHLAFFNRLALDLAARKITRLAVSCPPRHGKSSFFSRYLPAWWLGTFPNQRVIVTSYGAELATFWSGKARSDFEEWGEHCFRVKVSGRGRAGDNWMIAGHEGGMQAAGVGGPLTGRGSDCMPAGTKILTNKGEVAVEDLVRYDSGARVKLASWNCLSKTVEWKPILASRCTYANQLIEIITATGRVLRCTPDHRVYVEGIGYTQARFLSLGDRVAALPKEQDLCYLRQTEGRQGTELLGVLPEVQACDRSVDLRLVSGGIQQTTVSVRQVCLQGVHGHLLLPGMLPGASRHQESKAVHPLRNTCLEEDAEVLRAMPGSAAAQAFASQELPSVRHILPTQVLPDDLLWQDLCGYCPRQEDARCRQPELQGRQVVLETLRSDVRSGAGAGQRPVCRLSGDGIQGRQEAGGTPYQRRHDGQQAGESDNGLLQLPHEAPQIETDTISLVRHLRTASQPVYDIQVEGNSNFFADSILVHNCAIIDDPFKNAEEAHSPTQREKIWQWYLSTLLTRMEPGGVIVIINTRWDTDDLVGRLARQEANEDPEAESTPEPWVFVNLPALATEQEAAWPAGLGRKPGEALWPERFNRAKLLQICTKLGPKWWSALYQGSPIPAGGDTFQEEWFRITVSPPLLSRKVRFWDLAATEKKSDNDPDFTAGAKCGLDDMENFYVCDVRTLRDTPAGVINLLYNTALLDGPATPIVIEREGGASGKIAIDLIIRELRRRGLRACKILGQATGSAPKVARAEPVAGLAENRMLYLVRGPWNQDLITEAIAFPHGRHDDIIDAMSGAHAYLAGKRKLDVSSFDIGDQATPGIYNYTPT